MKGPQLTVSALPTQLPADGHTPSLLTANLLDGDGAPVSGATIEFFTDKGGLIIPPDPSGIGVPGVTATTGASGDARVELLPMTAKPVPSSDITPVAVGDTVTVTASYGSGATKVTATASVTIVGYTLELTLGQSKFQRVANVAPGGFQQDVYGGGSNGGPAAATRFGATSVGVRAKLSLGGVSVAGKRVLLGSSQALQAGSSYVRFEQSGSSTQITEVTTDANGEASFDVVVQDAWRAPAALPYMDVTAELADDTSVKAGAFRVDVRDNLAELLTRYRAPPAFRAARSCPPNSTTTSRRGTCPLTIRS